MRLCSQQWCREALFARQDTLGSRRACEDALVAALAAGQEVVVDRCNFDMAQRSTFLNLARRFRALVIALQFTVPVHECIRRAKARPNHPTLTSENTADIIQRYRVACPGFTLFPECSAMSHQCNAISITEGNIVVEQICLHMQ
jgi:predicted kinase